MKKEFQMKLLTIVSSTVCAAALLLASSSFAMDKKVATEGDDMGTKHSKHHKHHGHKHHNKSHKKSTATEE
jgi:hypothetical protein